MGNVTRRALGSSERRGVVEEAVFAATLELLNEGHSFPALSVGEIAGRAGIGRTTFYFYFPTKTDLLIRLVSDRMDELGRRASAWWRAEGRGDEQLREILPEGIGFLLDHGPVIRAVVDAAPLDPALAQSLQASIEFVVDTAVRRLQREQSVEPISGSSLRELITALTWMTERSCYRFALEPGRNREAFLGAQTEIWLRTLYCRAS
jgi:AcrR family transcriptional regulator